MTGAIMPAGCDTTIPQESIEINADLISFNSHSIRAGDNCRIKGEDLSQGKPAILKGKLIGPADLGLIASLGIAQLEVKKKLRVGFFSTGNELRSIGEPLDLGCIYDSNRYTIFGMLSRLGVEFIDFGVIRDKLEDLRLTFATAAAECDVVITSGGVSAGDADHTKQIMQEMGDVDFWKIDIKPGRPMAFGSIQSDDHEALLFGLPGNPVATMITFYQFVRPALLALSGASHTAPPLLKARTNQAIRKIPGRTEFQRGKLSPGDDGIPIVSAMEAQGSGILSSMSEADCLIVLGHDQAMLAAGDLVDIVLFEGLV
jgi:molybdopterin molybdotransferase